MKRLALVLLACCVAVFVVAQQAPTLDPDWKVPEKAVQQKNPLEGKPELAAGGRKLYERNCAQCHGDEKHERKSVAPDLGTAAVQQETDGALFWRISSGNTHKGMPSFSNLPEAQRWQLVMYIRALGKK